MSGTHDVLMMALLKSVGFTTEESVLKVLGTDTVPQKSTSVGREIQRLHAIAKTIPDASVDDISVANNFDVTLDGETVRVITEGGALGMINHREFGTIHYFGDEEETPLTHKEQLLNVLRGKDPWSNDDDDDDDDNQEEEQDLRSLD